jgi:hypothetical protein
MQIDMDADSQEICAMGVAPSRRKMARAAPFAALNGARSSRGSAVHYPAIAIQLGPRYH